MRRTGEEESTINTIRSLMVIMCAVPLMENQEVRIFIVYFKKLLKENGLPDIRWHDLRATYCTILLKNDFNPKAVSKLMGHAKEIITIDVYGDNREIIEDCLENLEPFIDEVLPEEEVIDLCDVDCMDLVALELIE